MENKYYTPELEEFHVGFEYEIWDSDTKEYFKWVIGDKYELCEALDEYPLVRVKYLDREDIESLGWKFDKEKGYCFNDYSMVLIMVNFDLNSIDYIKNLAIIDKLLNQICFNGTIKNKSELKRLMKQINII